MPDAPLIPTPGVGDDRPVPTEFLRGFVPHIDPTAWRWRSPTQLLADDPPWLVVFDDTYLEALASGIGGGRSLDDEAASLRRAVTAAAARHRDCQAGTPQLRDDGVCPYCGLPEHLHETPSDVPTFQETHSGWGGQVVTIAEVEAALTVELAAMKYRGRTPLDDLPETEG